MNLQSASANTDSDQIVPKWVKHNADWWASGQISDNDFLSGVQFSLDKGFLKT